MSSRSLTSSSSSSSSSASRSPSPLSSVSASSELPAQQSRRSGSRADHQRLFDTAADLYVALVPLLSVLWALKAQGRDAPSNMHRPCAPTAKCEVVLRRFLNALARLAATDGTGPSCAAVAIANQQNGLIVYVTANSDQSAKEAAERLDLILAHLRTVRDGSRDVLTSKREFYDTVEVPKNFDHRNCHREYHEECHRTYEDPSNDLGDLVEGCQTFPRLADLHHV